MSRIEVPPEPRRRFWESEEEYQLRRKTWSMIRQAADDERRYEEERRNAPLIAERRRIEREREERVELLLLEYGRTPELASEKYARDYARKHGARLIDRAQTIRNDFQRFYFGDRAFVELLKQRAGDNAESVINFATREHRALGYAILFDAEPPEPAAPDQRTPEIEPDDEVPEDEDIEILGR